MAFVTLIFAGQLGQAYLDGVGLANTLLNLLVIPVTAGYASVFDTYGPQVYAVRARGQGLSEVFWKCLLQGWLLLLVVLGPYLNTVYLVQVLPEQTQSTNLTGFLLDEVNGGAADQLDFQDIAVGYLRITVIVEFIDYAFVMISKYFAIVEETKPIYLLSALMVGSHALTNYIFVGLLSLGVDGIGIACIVGRIIPLTTAILLLRWIVRRREFRWSRPSRQTLLGWRPMIRLGISGATNVFAEMVLFEIACFCSQFDGATAFSVVLIMNQLVGIWWAVALGMARAGATLIGTAMGEQDLEKTRLSVKVSVWNSVIVSVIIAVGTYFTMEQQVAWFTQEEDVKRLFVSTFWIICMGIPMDHVQTSLNQGVLVAFGKQDFTACTMSIACYVLGLPVILGTIFFTDMTSAGVFLGLVVVGLFMFVTGLYKVLTVDIGEEVRRCMERNKADIGSDRRFGSIQRKGAAEDISLINDGSMPSDSEQSMLGEVMGGRDLQRQGSIKPVLIAFFSAGISFPILAALSLING